MFGGTRSEKQNRKVANAVPIVKDLNIGIYVKKQHGLDTERSGINDTEFRQMFDEAQN